MIANNYEIHELNAGNLDAALRMTCESFTQNNDAFTFLGVPVDPLVQMLLLPDLKRSFIESTCSFVVCRKNYSSQILAVGLSKDHLIQHNANEISLVSTRALCNKRILVPFQFGTRV